MAWKNPLGNAKPMTVGVFLLTALWAVFQWKDPTPPPALDQILIGAFGIWFANEAVGKNNGKGKRSVKIGKDGTVSISTLDDDEKEEADDDDGEEPVEGKTG